MHLCLWVKKKQPNDWVYFKQLGLIMDLSLNTVISKINFILSLINYKSLNAANFLYYMILELPQITPLLC